MATPSYSFAVQRLCGTPLCGFVVALWYAFAVQRLCGTPLQYSGFVALPLHYSGLVGALRYIPAYSGCVGAPLQSSGFGEPCGTLRRSAAACVGIS